MDFGLQSRRLWHVVILALPALVLLGNPLAAFAQDTPTPHTTALPTPSGSVLFSANFETGAFPGWTFNTAIVEVIPDESRTLVLSLTGDELNGSSAVMQGGSMWADYVIDLRLKIAEVDEFNELADLAIILRSDAQNSDFVAIFISTTADRAIIGSVVDNQIVNTFGVSYPFEPSVWYSIRVAVQGNRAWLMVDGQQIAETTIIGQAETGSAGLITFLGTRALLDDVQVFDLSFSDAEIVRPNETMANGLSSVALPTLGPLPTNTPREANNTRSEASPTTASSGTPSGTPTATLTNTPTPSLTPSLTRTPTLTPTGTLPTSTPLPTLTPTLTPTHDSPPTKVIAEVLVPNANLRSGPDTSYPTYGYAQLGNVFTVVAKADVNGQQWYLIEAPNGRQAWIWSDLIRLDPPDANIPDASYIPPSPTPPA